MKRFLPLVFAALVATFSAADSITYVRVDRQLLAEHLKLAKDAEADRIRTLHSLLQKAGCPQVMEQSVPKEDSPNLICILPGEEEGTIIIGASSDYAPEDAAAPSRWGALAMLPLLAESLSPVYHRFTVMLVAFSGSQHGMRGASWYLSQLTPEQRRPIKAMISLDNVGRTPAVFALTQSDKTLANWLRVAAFSLQLAPPAEVDSTTANLTLQNGVSPLRDEDLWSDAKPFQHENIPAIAIQSAMPSMVPSLQRSGALPDGVTGTGFDMDAFENTYRLTAVYVLYLDRNLDRPWVEPGVYSGKLVDTAGLFQTSPLDVAVKIDRFTTPNDLYRYERILQQGGQDALADALGNESERGNYRFGLNLAYDVKIVALQTGSGKTPHALLIGTRVKPRGSTSRDSRFTAIKLTLDSKGVGEGEYYNSVRLKFNKKHELEIEEFDSRPDDIRQVRLEQPKFQKASPETLMAAKSTPPQSAGGATPNPAPAGAAKVPTGPIVATATGPAMGSAPPPPASSIEAGATAIFKSQARLVQLDVAVLDSKGRPVTGLQASDFTVLEEGKPQQVRNFEPHVRSLTAAAAAPAAPRTLPPNTFANTLDVSSDEPLNILLLDMWNTPVTDQAYARKQTIQFLKSLPKGRTLAMYVLGRRLTMLQGFTDDASTLVASAEKIMTEDSLLLRTDAERQQVQGATENVGRVARPGVNAPGAPAGALSNIASGGSLDLGNAQARLRSDASMEADRTAERIYTTLDALTALSRSVSSYPGRKNLIWLSGSFPVRLKPSSAENIQLGLGSSAPTSGLQNAPNFPAALRATAMALATARIAVYPMDVRGIQVGGVDIGVGAAESASFAGTDNPGAFKDNLGTQSATRFEEHSAMQEVADQTGGALLNGNDVKDAIGRAIDDGSSYYAMAYTPEKFEGQQFRKIEVKVNRPGVKLAYRPGYFPNSKSDADAPKSNPLIVAMQPGVPSSTVIPITVQVLPPDGTNKKTRITYTIDISGIEFDDTPEHRKRAIIDCIAVAFSRQGAPVGQISNTLDATLPLADYNAAMKSGLVVPQELDLPPGQYTLRVGVMDRGSQKIGTLEAPLAITATAAAK